MTVLFTELAEAYKSDKKLSASIDSFLTAYREGSTRTLYEFQMKQFFSWVIEVEEVHPLEVKRVKVSRFLRYCENVRKNSPSTVATKLTAIRMFYNYAVADEFMEKNPTVMIKVKYNPQTESTRLGLNRYELGALIGEAQKSHPSEYALIVMMGMMGLRVSEAVGVKIKDFQSVERGHRVLYLVGKGGKFATIPLPVQIYMAMDACVGGRDPEEFLLINRWTGESFSPKSCRKIVRRLCLAIGVDRNITNHSLRHSFITACLDSGISLYEVQKAARHSDPRLTMMYDRARNNLDRHANHQIAAALASFSHQWSDATG